MGAQLTGKPDLGATAVYRRLARNSAFLGAGTIASALFMMLAVVLNARALSPREFGLLVLFQSATVMIATVMSFATQQPVIKLGATALAEGDLPRLGRIVGLGLLIDAFAAVTATIAAFVFLAAGRGLIGLPDEQLGLAALFAASLLFTGYLTSNGIFRLLDRFGLLSLIQTASAAAILFATAYLYASGARFEAYCWAWAIFYALNGLLPLVIGLYLARRAGIPIAFSTSRMRPGEMSTFLAYCWTTWGMATVEAVRTNGDSLLVGAAVSVEGAGIYNVAKQLAGVLRKMNTVYASAMFPEVSALSAHGEVDSAVRVRRRLLWISGLIGVAAVAAVALLGRLVLMVLFGERFEAAYLPLIILTAAAACQLISHTLSMYVQVYVGPHQLFRVYLLGMAVFLVAVFPLTSLLSITGTALANLLFALAMIYLCHWQLRKIDLAGKAKPA
ncbi:lipopolysaccharide biosynthesis protein [Sphingomonas sp.]|uniref:lipopolysaccharide biosynthesis protein n=1 Tax=Sphingomonas sp. TaxID=28214 RepID=UPI00182EB11F|nr:lipopolysaccharide biosynthesis protein [Sphingomonas sp.]MBA3511186.1 lipopolysaccharide biosynthesis protein [Sphingomonas sp.]